MQISDYERIKGELRAAAESYYRDGSSPLDDATYDALLADVAEYERQHNIVDDVVAEAIGSGAALGGTWRHSVPMLSLDNVYDDVALNRWRQGVAAELCVEPKLDGMAMAVHYADGAPVRMVTRGDGTTGEDVSAAMGLIDLPNFGGFNGEVRGEVIFSHEQFRAANNARVAAGGTEFANARNAAAGCINKAAHGGTVDATLSFIAYDVQGLSRTLHSEEMKELLTAGFTTAMSLVDSWSLDTKPVLDYDIDGLVFKVDDNATQEKLGSSSRAPRWARAFKYPPDVARTSLVDVLWQVGRTGSVTPRAVVKPVKVGGTTITYATLNNPSDIERKGLMLGDTVEIRRAAEVIPEITGNVVALRDGTERAIDIPVTCPNCDSVLDTSQARLRCPSGGECALDRRLSYAVSRDALDIEGMSEALVVALIDNGTLHDVADIFDLTEKDIATCPSGRTTDSGTPIVFGDAIAAKVKAEIERARREVPFERVVVALGLVGTGRSLSKRLASHFGSMDALLDASVSDLMAVDKLGTVKATSLHRQLRDARPVIDRLAAHGLSMETESVSGPLTGHIIVVTGSMRMGSRSDVAKKLEALGATMGSSVSQSTTLVVADDPEGTSSKLSKARKLGVRIIDEDTLVGMIQ